MAAGARRRRRRHRHRRRLQKPSVVSLTHHIFTKGEWRRARLAAHPTTSLTVVPERNRSTSAVVDGIADSGAQSNVWSLSAYLASGQRMSDLSPVKLSLNAANKSAIRIEGAFFADITGTTADGSTITVKAMIYVSNDVQGFYLSYSTMIDLGMLPKNFPTPGCAQIDQQTDFARVGEICGETTPPTHSPFEAPAPPCGGCRREESIPDRPSSLPFECIPENNKK